jgi:hypothetical protein
MNRTKYYSRNEKETNYGMFLAYLTLFTALTISGVAIFYSVSGLAAIFSAAVIPIIIMGGVLEVSKLVTAVWLHRYWRIATWWLKAYLSIAVLVLMLITSIGIFGFLSKAHDTASGNATEAIATVQRIDGQIAREENRIEILEDRIAGLNSGDGFDVSSSITQQQEIINGARGAVQADIDYNQTQITAINERLDRDLQALETSLTADIKVQTDKLIPLDELVASYRDEEDSGFINRTDNRGEAERVLQEQKPERDAIAAEITRLRDSARDREAELRREASVAVREAQGNINDYRAQTQSTVDAATAEINRLREQSNSSQDDDLAQIDEWNLIIDGIYTTIDELKGEKFESEQAVRLVESEVGPIRYIAEFFTGTEDADASLLETAVSWLIMVIIFVFDPLAVLLLIASQYTFEQRRKERFPEGEPELKKPEPKPDPEPKPEPDPEPVHEGYDSQPFGEEYPYLNFKEIEPSIDEVRSAFEDWEKEQQRLVEARDSAKQDHVVEHVSEPVPEPTLEEAKQALESWKDSLPEIPPIVQESVELVEEVAQESVEEGTVDTEITEISADSTEIITSGVTVERTVVPEGDYMLDTEGRSIHKDALKSLHPELFLQTGNETKSDTSFGIAFPKLATKGDIFVRVDANPNRVYKFEGTQWLEIQKGQSDSYLYNEEYIKHLVSRIETGEYDVDLLSDPEKVQIEAYLNSSK